jgi:hypothetical protein
MSDPAERSVCGCSLRPFSSVRLPLVAVIAAITLAVMLLSGCATGNGSSVAFTFNFFGSLSRFGQALGGTDTSIDGQSSGGGNAAATVPLTP